MYLAVNIFTESERHIAFKISMKDNCDIQTEKTIILTFPDVKAILVHAIFNGIHVHSFK